MVYPSQPSKVFVHVVTTYLYGSYHFLTHSYMICIGHLKGIHFQANTANESCRDQVSMIWFKDLFCCLAVPAFPAHHSPEPASNHEIHSRPSHTQHQDTSRWLSHSSSLAQPPKQSIIIGRAVADSLQNAVHFLTTRCYPRVHQLHTCR